MLHGHSEPISLQRFLMLCMSLLRDASMIAVSTAINLHCFHACWAEPADNPNGCSGAPGAGAVYLMGKGAVYFVHSLLKLPAVASMLQSALNRSAASRETL